MPPLTSFTPDVYAHVLPTIGDGIGAAIGQAVRG
jgi:hypothetical protein